MGRGHGGGGGGGGYGGRGGDIWPRLLVPHYHKVLALKGQQTYNKTRRSHETALLVAFCVFACARGGVRFRKEDEGEH